MCIRDSFGPTYRPLDTDRTIGSWDEDQARTVETVEFGASVSAASVYVCSGAASNLTWGASVDAFCERVAPAVARAAELGVPLLLEPTNPLRADISFVFWQRDAMDVARAAGTKVMLCLLYTSPRSQPYGRTPRMAVLRFDRRLAKSA